MASVDEERSVLEDDALLQVLTSNLSFVICMCMSEVCLLISDTSLFLLVCYLLFDIYKVDYLQSIIWPSMDCVVCVVVSPSLFCFFSLLGENDCAWPYKFYFVVLNLERVNQFNFPWILFALIHFSIGVENSFFFWVGFLTYIGHIAQDRQWWRTCWVDW